MTRDIKSTKFFEDVMVVFQRTYEEGIVKEIYNTEDLTKEEQQTKLEYKADEIFLSRFIKEINDKEEYTTEEINDILNRLIDTFFLEKARYDRYFAPFYGTDKDKFEKELSEKLDIGKENVSVEELTNNILRNLENMRNTINEQAKGRDRFSFDKSARELIERSRKIATGLKKNNIELNEDNSLKGALINIAKEILEEFNKENNSGEVLDTKEQIEMLADQIKSVAKGFDDISKGLLTKSDLRDELEVLNDIEDIKKLPSLRSKDNPGVDFEIRINKIFKELLLDEGQRKRKSYQTLTKKEKETYQKELTQDQTFSRDFRNLIVKILSVSNVETNQSTKRLFLNEGDIEAQFHLDPNIINSFLNITVSTTDNNLELLKAIAGFTAANKSNILDIINNNPKKELKKLRDLEFKGEFTNNSEEKVVKNGIKEIESIEEEFEKFQDNHGEFVNDFIEEEFLKVLNGGIHSIKTNENFAQKLQEAKSDKNNIGLNNSEVAKKLYSYEEAKLRFYTIEDFNEMVELLLVLKENAKVLRRKLNGFSALEMKEIELVINNFAVKSFKDLSDETFNKIKDNKEEIYKIFYSEEEVKEEKFKGMFK